MVTQLFWSSFCYWAERSDFHSTPAQLCPHTLLLIVSPVYMLLRLEFDHAEPLLNEEMRSEWGFELTSVARLTLRALRVHCLCLSVSPSLPISLTRALLKAVLRRWQICQCQQTAVYSEAGSGNSCSVTCTHRRLHKSRSNVVCC